MTLDPRLPRRILVVDDDLTLCDILRVWLDGDREVRFAHDGEEALRVAKEERPDLVLLDVMMPRLSGFSVAWVVKNDPRLQGVPVVFMTAHAVTMADAKRKLERADAYLLKPFSRDQLLTVMGRLLPGSESPVEAPARGPFDERRLSPRLAVSIDATLAGSDQVPGHPLLPLAPVRVCSLSPVGAFVEGELELAPGAKAELRIATPRGQLDAPCRVAYRAERDGRTGYGMELGEMSTRSEALFEQLLHELSTSCHTSAS